MIPMSRTTASSVSSQSMLMVGHQQRQLSNPTMIPLSRATAKSMSPMSSISSQAKLFLRQQQGQQRQRQLSTKHLSCRSYYSSSTSPTFKQQDNNGKEGYYYDSQSGMYVPIHDESKVSIYVDIMTRSEVNNSSSDSLITESKLQNLLQNMDKLGIAGVKFSTPSLPPTTRSASNIDDDSLIHLIENLATTAHTNNMTSQLFVPYRDDLDFSINTNKNTVTNLNLMFEYNADIYENLASTIMQSKTVAASSSSSSLGLFDIESCYDEDPIVVSSNIASILDIVGPSSCNYIWLAPKTKTTTTAATQNEDDTSDNVVIADNVDSDTVVELCEQLMYMDVLGATIQSRLVVSIDTTTTGTSSSGSRVVDEDLIEECLDRGINKFSITSINIQQDDNVDGNISDNEESNVTMMTSLEDIKTKIEMLDEIVSDNGKELILLPNK